MFPTDGHLTDSRCPDLSRFSDATSGWCFSTRSHQSELLCGVTHGISASSGWESSRTSLQLLLILYFCDLLYSIFRYGQWPIHFLVPHLLPTQELYPRVFSQDGRYLASDLGWSFICWQAAPRGCRQGALNPLEARWILGGHMGRCPSEGGHKIPSWS